MILEVIKLKGFLSFIDDEIDLRQSHIALIYGANGEGKSALLESVPFCFWGEGRAKTLSEFVNENCDTARVEIVFLMEGIRYKKVRQYGNAGNINELYIDKNNQDFESAKWRLLTDDSKKKTDAELSKILSLDYNLFSNSVFFGQKEQSSFIEGSASERKELLSNLLGIQIYEQAEELAKNNIKNIESSIQTKSIVLNDKKVLASNVKQLRQQLLTDTKQYEQLNESEKNIHKLIDKCNKQREEAIIAALNVEKNTNKLKDINSQIDKEEQNKLQIKNDLKKANELLESTIDDGIIKVEELQNIIVNEEKFKNNKTAFEEKLNVISKEKAKIPAIKEKLISQRDEKEKLIQQKTEVDTTVKSLNAKIKKIESSGAICPIIDQPCDKLSKQNKERMIDDIKLEVSKQNKVFEQIQNNLNFTIEKIVEFDGQLEAISKRINNESEIVKSLATVSKDLDTIALAKEKLPDVKKKYRKLVDDLSKTKDDLEKRLSVLIEEIKQIELQKIEIEKLIAGFTNNSLKSIDRQISSYNDDLKTIRLQVEDTKEAIGQTKNKLVQAEQAEEDVKKIQLIVDELSKKLRVYTELSIAFGKNGIQKEIISSNVPILEQTTNELLSKFTNSNNKFTVKFDLDPVTSKGKLKKTGGLDIIINQNNKQPRPLNMYSGGETVRIVFAILLSLSQLLTKRAGKRSQTLIIDERVAALDAEGISQFIDIVNYISKQYKKILIVSHISELNESFPNIIKVSKDATKGSKVSYHGQFSQTNGSQNN